MAVNALVAFLHFAAVFGVVATVFLEWQTMSPAPTVQEARRIQRCDRWYGFFAMALLVVGFVRVFWLEKGSAFYFSNPVFKAKLTLFALAGIASIYPTLRFARWRAQTRRGEAPRVSPHEHRWIMMSLRAEVALLLGTALCASFMARGIGL